MRRPETGRKEEGEKRLEKLEDTESGWGEARWR
jgi:hypothetical protein